jgi:hypothetical protein
VVGINAQIYSQSGGFQGLAFAIPLDVALHVKEQIVAKGRVDHARLGVTLQDLSAPLASSFGLASPSGALVASVVPGSAAEKAGLKSGDVITAVDGSAGAGGRRCVQPRRPGQAGRTSEPRAVARQVAQRTFSDAGPRRARARRAGGRGRRRHAGPGGAPAATRRVRAARGWTTACSIEQRERARRSWPACSAATCCWH